MTNKEAAKILIAMLDALDPCFLAWNREQRKAEALSMAIALLEREDENNVEGNSISAE